MLSLIYKTWRKVSVCCHLSYNFEFFRAGDCQLRWTTSCWSAQCQEACVTVYIQCQWKLSVIIQTINNLGWGVSYFYFILIILTIVVCLWHLAKFRDCRSYAEGSVCVMLKSLEKETVGRTHKGKLCPKKRWVQYLLNNWSLSYKLHQPVHAVFSYVISYCSFLEKQKPCSNSA